MDKEINLAQNNEHKQKHSYKKNQSRYYMFTVERENKKLTDDNKQLIELNKTLEEKIIEMNERIKKLEDDKLHLMKERKYHQKQITILETQSQERHDVIQKNEKRINYLIDKICDKKSLTNDE